MKSAIYKKLSNEELPLEFFGANCLFNESIKGSRRNKMVAAEKDW